jgi:hypothetical protein
MPKIESYEILVLGSGESGKYLAWTTAKEGRRTALVERDALGGACPNVACLPSKNIIYSAKIASLARRATEFGVEMDSVRVNMASVQRRKRAMVDDLHRLHLDRQAASGAGSSWARLGSSRREQLKSRLRMAARGNPRATRCFSLWALMPQCRALPGWQKLIR